MTKTMWQVHTLNHPRDSECRLHVDGRYATLEDSLDRIIEHYRSRPPDSFLAGRLECLLQDGSAVKGAALRDGRLQLGDFPPCEFPSNPTWAEDPFSDRAWQWRLHSLTVFRYLLAAHRKSDDEWYLNRAEELALDWMYDNYGPTPPSEFSWSDHSTALRLENLLYFLEYARQRRLSPVGIACLLGLVSTHARILSEPSFYVSRTNHGMDQSCMLYLAGAAFPEFVEAKKWRVIARNRILEEIAFAFTDEGVHVENSASYHLTTLNRTVEIDAMLRHYEGGGLGPKYGELLSNGFRFAAYLIKPDGTLPIVGDTEAGRVRDHPAFRIGSGLGGYEEFRYSVTQGRGGAAPVELFRVLPKSGYAILRDAWESSAFSQSLYLLFKAGFLSTYHKHDDDLSFVLYNKGEDWIIDSGLYRYQEADPLRQYMRSPRAHNGVVVDDLVMGRGNKDLGKSRIDTFDFDVKTGCATVQGSHTLYPGMKVTRELAYRRPGTITVTDGVVGEVGKEHRFRVLFHVPVDKTVTVTDRGAIIRSARTGEALQLTVTEGNVCRGCAIRGQEVPEFQGWTSPKYGQRENSICICFEGVGIRLHSTIEFTFRRL